MEELHFIKCEPNNEESATSDFQEIKFEPVEISKSPNRQKENAFFIKEEPLNQDVKEEFEYEQSNISEIPSDEIQTASAAEDLLTSTKAGALCNICGKKFRSPSVLRRHQILHSGLKSFPCTSCNKSFATKWKLQEHTRIHTREKLFYCSICQKGFGRKSHLIEHLVVHTRDKQHNCTYCLRTFAKKCDLNRHIETHGEKGRFSCSYCERSFNYRGCLQKHLLTHERVHVREKIYSCDTCKQQFPNSSSWKFHMKIHIPDTYSCSSCGETFIERLTYDRHMLKHAKHKPYECIHCGMTFCFKSNLTQHMSQHTDHEVRSLTEKGPNSH